MTEKGIIVNDALTGESVACRDAVELDDDFNARVIQRVDVCKGKLPALFGEVETLIRTIYSPDGWVLSSWPSEVWSNCLTVGDKSTLVVYIESDNALSASHIIIPVVLKTYGEGIAQQGFLAPVDIYDGGNKIPIETPAGEGTLYKHQLEYWDVLGAELLTLAMPVSAGSPSIRLYAAVI